jgi:hypothetical protein
MSTTILKFSDHNNYINIADKFIDIIINPKLNESLIDNNFIKKILKGFSKDLKFNYGSIFTFGTGIKFMYPIVENLIKNGNIKIELTSSNIILLTLTALCIIYLEENNNKIGDSEVRCQDCSGTACEKCGGSGFINSIISKSDAQTLLEELKLRGIGNGIVKKLVLCFNSITNILKIIFNNTPHVVSSLLDMFGYTALLIPTMNAILSLINNYKFDMDTLPMNFLSIGVGVTTLLAKNGFNYLSNKLKMKLYTNDTIPYEIKDGDVEDMGKSQLIKEQ